MKKRNFTIIGSGAYGTCLANILADNEHDVVVYGINNRQLDDIAINHQNSMFFDDLKLNYNIKTTNDLTSALSKTDVLILAVPTTALKSIISQICQTTNRKMFVINTAKGLDEENSGLLSTFIKNEFKKAKIMQEYLVLHGPSIASEVIKRLPTGVTLACDNQEVVQDLKPYFANEYFAIETSSDVVGCEIAAALKNGLAIGAGILDGLNIGYNARGSLLTLGIKEIYEISKIFNGQKETIMSFAAIGDLILTATSPKSRNYSLGYEIATNSDIKQVLENNNKTTEGVKVVKIVHDIALKNEINPNIFLNLYEILYNFKRPVLLANNFLK